MNLTIYDLSGRAVKTLLYKTLPPGTYTVSWDGTDNLGNPVASGVYLYRLRQHRQVLTRKMILIR
ncbi:MAG: T9SS C-terminal target domain-containing protein [Methanobacteriota archaeon]|nr:MAG: T9SS C-terminal target domain-containing protein [Euryarchaeota archaeon]